MSLSSDVRPYVFASLLAPPPVGVADLAVVEPAEDSALVAEQDLGPTLDVEALASEARERGYAEGYAEGLRQAQVAQGAALAQLAALVENAVHQTSGFTQGLEAQLVELALAVAEKVLEREVSIDPALVVGVLRGALQEMQEAASVQVRVNPRDHEVVAEHWDVLLRRPVAERSQLIADERIQCGGCVLETQLGQVDAQLATKLSQIAHTFSSVLEGEPV
jgi:flagellar assembly protein FliH